MRYPVNSDYPYHQTCGVILAGGRARRMAGEDKGLVLLGGQPMVSYAVAALAPQTARLLINANRNQQRYAKITGCRIIADTVTGFAGPLAGILSALQICDSRYLLCAPCDCPLLPTDLGARLFGALVEEDAEISVVHDGQRLQPVFSLIQAHLKDSLAAYLAIGEKKIDRWYQQHRLAYADFSDTMSAFQNVNTLAECQAMETTLMGTSENLA